MERQQMIESNLRLVSACCKRFTGRGIEYDDLYGAGCVGLIKAVDGYNSELGFCFSTYAVPVILGEIKRLFRDGGAIKVSRGLKELSLKVQQTKNNFCLKNGREPTVFELAELLEVTPEEVAEAIGSAVEPKSLSYAMENGEVKEMDIGSVKSAEDEITDRLTIEQMLNRLEPKDRQLIRLRYFAGKTQSQTAELLYMTQVQVSRREKKLLQFMAELLK